jgi:uncharacterized protein
MKAVIFHGLGSTSEDNWFPWLKNELERNHIKTAVPDLPYSQNPKQREWLKEAMKLKYDEETILIGHSLGTILILRLLEQFKVKAAFLVAAFDDPLNIPEIKNFFDREFYYPLIRTNAKIYILNSDNDPYIPNDVGPRLAANTGAKLFVFKGREHLSGGTGDMMFPELRDMILQETR